MHGNEVVGREVLLKLIDDLCAMYKAGDKDVVNLILWTRIWILPTMNPDGWAIANAAGEGRGWVEGRANANNVDLNRNFPDLDRKLFRGKDINDYKVEGSKAYFHASRSLIRCTVLKCTVYFTS